MQIQITAYTERYVKEAVDIWDQVVEDGVAFPQMELLTEETGDLFFKEQSYTGLAVDAETVILPVSISCIRTISDGAAISATPAMPCTEICGDIRSEKRWCATAFRKRKNWDLRSFSSTPSWHPTRRR